MEIALFVLAGLLILIGLAGTLLPALPGIPLVYAGMFLAAWADHFQHIGWVTLAVLGALCLIALAIDFFASLVGAKRVGASGWALAGAAVGTVVGLFFGLVGVLAGPFAGALAGELVAGGTLRRATSVGLGTWLGMVLGALVKVALAFTMLGVFAVALLFG
ncbi:MAG TPA: DUF456 domain-containing protein [Rhodanobacteraceae bacterium]|nr:DUF456 domain-containing protein [Rhodanobacteraceae bacterium]